MLRKFVALVAIVLCVGIESLAAPPAAASKSSLVAARGGYRYRRYSYPGYGGGSYRGSGGRASALDYPPWTQPTASRMHQWNKYPNQPYYLRGERKSLGILP